MNKHKIRIFVDTTNTSATTRRPWRYPLYRITIFFKSGRNKIIKV